MLHGYVPLTQHIANPLENSGMGLTAPTVVDEHDVRGYYSFQETAMHRRMPIDRQ